VRRTDRQKTNAKTIALIRQTSKIAPASVAKPEMMYLSKFFLWVRITNKLFSHCLAETCKTPAKKTEQACLDFCFTPENQSKDACKCSEAANADME
jgi:ribosomal protein S19